METTESEADRSTDDTARELPVGRSPESELGLGRSPWWRGCRSELSVRDEKSIRSGFKAFHALEFAMDSISQVCLVMLMMDTDMYRCVGGTDNRRSKKSCGGGFSATVDGCRCANTMRTLVIVELRHDHVHPCSSMFIID